jgi:hypothetical protein
MIPIADEQTQLEQFEGLERIEDDVDELGVDIFELRYLWSLVQLGLFLPLLVADGNERLISLELFEELEDGVVDDGDDVDNFPHDFVLHEDVAFGLDDLHVQVVVLFSIVDDRVFRLQFVGDLGDGVPDPKVVGVHHGFYAFEVGLQFVFVLRVDVLET